MGRRGPEQQHKSGTLKIRRAMSHNLGLHRCRHLFDREVKVLDDEGCYSQRYSLRHLFVAVYLARTTLHVRRSSETSLMDIKERIEAWEVH